MRFLQVTVILLFTAAQVLAHATYTGYSGAPARQTCASSCHGSGTGSVTVTGFPSSYTPLRSYSLSISQTSGSNIANFNASCRVGSSSTNAGAFAAGTGTTTYNVTGETNGVHFTNAQQSSGTFTWVAPMAGTGTVTLYMGAHQGTSSSGPNTTLVLVSSEASPPAVASNPNPANNATGVLPTATLSWTAGTGATSHDVFFGTGNPPDSVTNQAGTTFTPADSMTPGTVYYWRINERNAIGVTAGPVWQFTVLSAPEAATDPSPEDMAPSVCIGDTLRWTVGIGATSSDIYFGTTNPPPFIIRGLAALYDPPGNMTPGTLYYWQINERNAAGLTDGSLWSFTTMDVPGMASNPFPADGDTNITVRVTLSWDAGTTVDGHDVYFGTTNPPPLVMQDQSGGSYTPLQNPDEGTVCYWRVNEVNCSGTTQGPVWSFRTEGTNSAHGRASSIPTELALGPVYPNPFNATVSIPFALPQAAKVQVALYDVTGRQVAEMAKSTYGAGFHSIQWSSQNVGSGVYFVRLTAGGKVLNAKVVALK